MENFNFCAVYLQDVLEDEKLPRFIMTNASGIIRSWLCSTLLQHRKALYIFTWVPSYTRINTIYKCNNNNYNNNNNDNNIIYLALTNVALRKHSSTKITSAC